MSYYDTVPTYYKGEANRFRHVLDGLIVSEAGEPESSLFCILVWRPRFCPHLTSPRPHHLVFAQPWAISKIKAHASTVASISSLVVDPSPADCLEVLLACALHLSSMNPHRKTLHRALERLDRIPGRKYFDLEDLISEHSCWNDAVADEKSFGIYLLAYPGPLRGYVGKTMRSFGRRWSEHVNENIDGVNDKIRRIKEKGVKPTRHVLINYEKVPAGYRSAGFLSGKSSDGIDSAVADHSSK